MALFAEFIDMMYPPRCHVCSTLLVDSHKDVPHLCRSCLEDFTPIRPPFCPVCGVPFHSMTGENHLCEACMRKRPAYDSLSAPYLYKGGIMEAIHRLKYGGKTHLADSLGKLLAVFAMDRFAKTDNYLIMPVPLHPRKLRERGFNQSLLLSKAMRRALDLDLDFLSLRRIKDTKPQTGLKRDERRKNVRKAFHLLPLKRLKGRTVVLVDDVATTGSTLNECGRVLKKAGCHRVFCLVLARTPGSL